MLGEGLNKIPLFSQAQKGVLLLIGYFFRMSDQVFGNVLSADFIGKVSFETSFTIGTYSQRVESGNGDIQGSLKLSQGIKPVVLVSSGAFYCGIDD